MKKSGEIRLKNLENLFKRCWNFKKLLENFFKWFRKLCKNKNGTFRKKFQKSIWETSFLKNGEIMLKNWKILFKKKNGKFYFLKILQKKRKFVLKV